MPPQLRWSNEARRGQHLVGVVLVTKVVGVVDPDAAGGIELDPERVVQAAAEQARCGHAVRERRREHQDAVVQAIRHVDEPLAFTRTEAAASCRRGRSPSGRW